MPLNVILCLDCYRVKLNVKKEKTVLFFQMTILEVNNAEKPFQVWSNTCPAVRCEAIIMKCFIMTDKPASDFVCTKCERDCHSSIMPLKPQQLLYHPEYNSEIDKCLEINSEIDKCLEINLVISKNNPSKAV